MPRPRTRRATGWQADSSSDDEEYSYREKRFEELENVWVAPVSQQPSKTDTPRPTPATLPPRVSSLPSPPTSMRTTSHDGPESFNPWAEATDHIEGDIGMLGSVVHEEPVDLHVKDTSLDISAESPEVENTATTTTIRTAEEAWQTSFGKDETSTSQSINSNKSPRDPWDILMSTTDVQPAEASEVLPTLGSADDLLAFLSGGNVDSIGKDSSTRQANVDSLGIGGAFEENDGPRSLKDASGVALAAEPFSNRGSESDIPLLESEKDQLIRQVLLLQKTLQKKIARVVTAKTEHAKQQSENQVLHQYITNLMTATRKMEKEKEVVKVEKPMKRGRRLFG